MALYTGLVYDPTTHSGEALDVTAASSTSPFAPQWELVLAFKRGTIAWEEYTRRYVKQMRALWTKHPEHFRDVIARAIAGDVTLLCFCRGQTCHRYLLAGILQKIARHEGQPLVVATPLPAYATGTPSTPGALCTREGIANLAADLAAGRVRREDLDPALLNKLRHHLAAPPAIRFHSRTPAWASLSNFYAQPFVYRVTRVKGAEWAYQAMKACVPGEARRVLDAPTPGEAKRIGGQITCRAGWDAIKERVMRGVLRAKFADAGLRQQLLATGDAILVHEAPWDAYWGSGRDGTGQNVLGRLLMALRQELAQDGSQDAAQDATGGTGLDGATGATAPRPPASASSAS